MNFIDPLGTNYDKVYGEYIRYTKQIPSNGGIIFNKAMDKILFVYYIDNEFGQPKLDFPKGKVNEGETPLQCAMREIHEELSLQI